MAISNAEARRKKSLIRDAEGNTLHIFDNDGTGKCIMCGQSINGIAHPSTAPTLKGQLYDFAQYIANESGGRTSVTRWFLPVDHNDSLAYPPGQNPLPDPNTWYIEADGFEFQVTADENYNITTWHIPKPDPNGHGPYPVMFLLSVIEWLTAIINKGREAGSEADRG